MEYRICLFVWIAIKISVDQMGLESGFPLPSQNIANHLRKDPKEAIRALGSLIVPILLSKPSPSALLFDTCDLGVKNTWAVVWVQSCASQKDGVGSPTTCNRVLFGNKVFTGVTE